MLWFLLSLLLISLQSEEAQQRHALLPFNDDVVLCEGDSLQFVCRPRPNNVTVSLLLIRPEQIPPGYPNDNMEDVTLSLRNASHIVITSKNFTVPVVDQAKSEELLEFSYLYGPLRPSYSAVYACLVVPIVPSDLRTQMQYMTLSVKAGCRIPDWCWPVLSASCAALCLLFICGAFIYYRQPIKQPVHCTILITHDRKKQSFEKVSSLSSVFVPSTDNSSSYPSSQCTNSDQRTSATLDPICHPSVYFRTNSTECATSVRRYQQSVATLRRRIRHIGSIAKLSDVNKTADRLLSEVNVRFSALYRLPSDDSHGLPRDHLTIQSCIGAGAFGVVYSAWAHHLPNRSSTQDKLPVAVKTIRGNFTESDVVDLIREMDIMKQLNKHPHVIELLGVCTHGGAPLLVMEYAPHGNLRSFLRTNKSKLQQSLMMVAHLLEFGRQVADGMKYLASRSVIHRDLAARNILVGEKHLLKIADFGLTRTVENYYRKQSDGRLPIKWLSPESLFDRIYTTKSDIWSFGVLLWEIFTLGLSPFSGFEPAEVPRLLRTGYRNPKPRLAGDRIYGMMQACWEFDPLKRPSFDHLFKQLIQWHQDECQYRGIVRTADCEAFSMPLSTDIFEEQQPSAESSGSQGKTTPQKSRNNTPDGSGRYAEVGDTDAVYGAVC